MWLNQTSLFVDDSSQSCRIMSTIQQIILSFNMKKDEFQDYYSLLGVEVECDEKAINKAYRLLAKKYHPDKNQGNEKASRLNTLLIRE